MKKLVLILTILTMGVVSSQYNYSNDPLNLRDGGVATLSGRTLNVNDNNYEVTGGLIDRYTTTLSANQNSIMSAGLFDLQYARPNLIVAGARVTLRFNRLPIGWEAYWSRATSVGGSYSGRAIWPPASNEDFTVNTDWSYTFGSAQRRYIRVEIRDQNRVVRQTLNTTIN